MRSTLIGLSVLFALPALATPGVQPIHTTIDKWKVRSPAQPHIVAHLTDGANQWKPLRFTDIAHRPVDTWELAGAIPKGTRMKDIAELSRSWGREVAVYRDPKVKGRAGLHLVMGEALSVATPEDSKIILHTHPLNERQLNDPNYVGPSSQDVLIFARRNQPSSFILPVSLDSAAKDPGFVQKVNVRVGN